MVGTIVRISVVCFVLVVSVSPGSTRAKPQYLGNHHDSPVYYEIEPVPYYLVANRELLHRDKLQLWHFPIVDVAGWDWRKGGIDDRSWWIQVEELRFLLPLLKSDREDDRELARKWFRSWYQSEQQSEAVNVTRWNEPMSAAFRGMVLVYFLKTEENREELDIEVVTMLREALIAHQEYLADRDHFDADSNHGLVEAFSLLEITRVFPNTDYENLGLDRLIEISDRSVSKLGTHKEHSPPYHFAFLDWLDGYSAYIETQPQLDKDKVAEIVECARRMRDTSYYLRDHDGTIPEIGDADSMNVSFRYPAYIDVGKKNFPPAFYDPEAGYAIYKDSDRYVMFTIQNEKPELPYHYHGDALAVYYRYKDETILGDPGKFEYTGTSTRRYFVSMTSHNTVVPTAGVDQGVTAILAKSPGFVIKETGTEFTATLDHNFAFRVNRRVIVQENSKSLDIVDSFRKLSNPNAPPTKKINKNKMPVVSKPTKLKSAQKRRQPVRKHPKHRTTQLQKGDRSARPRPEWSENATMVWNFGYDVFSVSAVDPAEGEIIAYLLKSKNGRKFRFSAGVAEGAEPGSRMTAKLYRGQTEPMRGWYSPMMYTMRPSYTLLVNIEFEEPTTVTTRIEEVEKKYFPGLRILIKGY